jgi:hypothetical protein
VLGRVGTPGKLLKIRRLGDATQPRQPRRSFKSPTGRGIFMKSAPMFRISRNGQEPIVNIDHVAQIEPEIRALPAGRWHIDELPAEPFRSGHTARRWGVGIKCADGSVVLERDPWP